MDTRPVYEGIQEMNTVQEVHGENVVLDNIIETLIPVDEIEPFHDHPFRLYEGKKLEEMVDSIKEYGVLTPVIVLKHDEHKYEMLSGHNRWNAAKIIGKKDIPAIVKEGLSDREAYIYVIETNMIQRAFSELCPSEQAAVIKERTEKITCQGKRNDIRAEIENISGKTTDETCGQDVHKSKSRDRIGEDLGMTGRNVARYLRIAEATKKLKDMLDLKKVGVTTAVELSYLAPEEQELLGNMVEKDNVKIKTSQATKLRAATGTLTEEKIKNILLDETKIYTAEKLFTQIKEKYFRDKTIEEIAAVLENALIAWFEKENNNN